MGATGMNYSFVRELSANLSGLFGCYWHDSVKEE